MLQHRSALNQTADAVEFEAAAPAASGPMVQGQRMTGRAMRQCVRRAPAQLLRCSLSLSPAQGAGCRQAKALDPTRLPHDLGSPSGAGAVVKRWMASSISSPHPHPHPQVGTNHALRYTPSSPLSQLPFTSPASPGPLRPFSGKLLSLSRTRILLSVAKRVIRNSHEPPVNGLT